MIEELIQADINASDENGKSALHWAASVDNVDAVKTLLAHGAIRDAQVVISYSFVEMSYITCIYYQYSVDLVVLFINIINTLIHYLFTAQMQTFVLALDRGLT